VRDSERQEFRQTSASQQILPDACHRAGLTGRGNNTAAALHIRIDTTRRLSPAMKNQTKSNLIFHNVQALRALAALSVVIFHLSLIEKKYFAQHIVSTNLGKLGTAGVDLFFVISGFVMVVVSIGQFGKNGAAFQFLLRRMIRILPIYWIYTTIVLVIFIVTPQLVNASTGHKANIIASFTLFPTLSVPLVSQAWTLTYELFFYIVFAVLICSSKEKMLPVWLTVWGAVTLAGFFYLGGRPAHAITAVTTNPLVLEFIAGCAAALIYPSLSRSGALACQLGAIVLVAASFLFADGDLVDLRQFAHGAFADPIRWRAVIFGLPSFALVLGAVSTERRYGWTAPGVLRRMGDASYSLYLSHVLVMSAVGRLWMRLASSHWNSAWGSIACVVAAVTVGLLGYRFVERPLNSMLKSIAFGTNGLFPSNFGRHPD